MIDIVWSIRVTFSNQRTWTWLRRGRARHAKISLGAIVARGLPTLARELPRGAQCASRHARLARISPWEAIAAHHTARAARNRIGFAWGAREACRRSVRATKWIVCTRGTLLEDKRRGGAGRRAVPTIEAFITGVGARCRAECSSGACVTRRCTLIGRKLPKRAWEA